MSKKMTPIDVEVKAAEREKLLDMYKTAKVKVSLINDLKTGLGDELKKGPSKVKIIKKTWSQKIIIALKKVFTTF